MADRQRGSGSRYVTVLLLLLGPCAGLVLGSGIHAYLGRTVAPWLTTASGAVPLALLVGLVVGVVLLVQGCSTRRVRVAAAIGLMALLGGVAIWWVALGRADLRRPAELRNECLVHVRDLVQALQSYAAEQGSWPASEEWQDALVAEVTPRTRRDAILRCPLAPKLSVAYAYNDRLSGIAYDAVTSPSEAVVVFESAAGPGASGGPELLPSRPRHYGGDNYGFADGSVRWVPREKAKELQWQPVLKKPAHGGKQEEEREDRPPD